MKTSTSTLTIGAAVLAVGVLPLKQQAQAAAFTAGDLVVDQIGTGAAALSNASTAVVLREYTASGTSVQSLGLAVDGTSVTQSGTATSEGFLHFSADGSSLLIPGYNVASGVTGIATTTSTAAPRAIAQFNLGGTQTSVTQLGAAFSGNNIRGAASADGSTLFAAGGTTGIVTATAGTNGSTVISTTNTNNRDLNVFGGNIYFTAGSGTTGLYQINGTSTATGQAATVVATTGTSPYGFSVSSDGLTAYVADSGSVLRKYTRTATTIGFTLAYTAAIAGGVTGLTVSYGATNTIYYDNPTTIFSTTDTGTSFGTIGTLATAATNTAFRGLDIVPVPEPATLLGGALSILALAWSQRRRLTSAFCSRTA